jgi:hypothetical protein
MFPFDKHGGVLHLDPTAAERVAYLVVDTNATGEPLAAPVRDPRLFPASRVALLPDGWVRALAARDVAGERVLADVLFAPGEVIAIHYEWVAEHGPGATEDGQSETAEERMQSWEASFEDRPVYATGN